MAATVGPEPIDVPDLPGPDSGLVHAASPYAGHLFVQGTVDGEAFDDVHGAGWRLVTSDAGSRGLDADLEAWFASIGGEIVNVAEPGSRARPLVRRARRPLGAAAPRLPPVRHGDRSDRRGNCCSPTFASTSATPTPP